MAKTALSGAHTAGIYADLTLDGPEIGTLVVIVDRAKNLPNRKTMGKQDPYCAARLGKEAKKTDTDKRGGQTPKWDQEMRFTVHDSPDYYQLKVSVFNDDRKTELIGETWVPLDRIIIPGGGTNDLWHGLNCKGRYAGDIRIELTYYDIRPKLENAEGRRQSAPVMGSMDQVSSGIGGPRQPKPVKRRPLPADPTDPSRSSPLPQTPPPISQNLSSSQQRYVASPDDYGFQSTPPTDKRHQRLQDEQPRSSPLANSQQAQRPYNDNPNMAPAPSQPDFDMYESTSQADYRQVSAPVLGESPQNGQPYDQENEYDTEYADDWQMRPLAQPLQNGMIHSNSSPAMVDHRLIDPRLRQNTMPHAWPDAETVVDDEGPPPPPPPAHRSIPLAAPLTPRARGNITGSISGSPLAKVQSNSTFQGYQPSVSPSNSQGYLHHGMPPSLVPGYESKIAEDESERTYERRMSARQQSLNQPLPQTNPASSATQSIQQPLPRSFENMQERRAHRYSAPVDRYSTPISKPRAVSPDPRTPVRKSLSPQPAPAERPQQSGIPFSPDSFDAYNPSISAANGVNDPGARYSTPEQATEASRQHERQEKLGDGPIIGNDGRIIDPSDHLPTNTWAPEPEQKSPTRRGPEVTVRFRNSPQGAQPMPSAGRRPLNEASTPLYNHNAGNSPSNPPNRNRLQKYPRISPGNVPPPVPGKIPIGRGKEDWGDALSEEMRRIDIGSGRRRGYGP
ncbi:hypothetical protein HO133_005732 [Letharia lupina]|uniref:C2 domain-containing protein n=1 Tax=Letharia lupina TaxID=560253 RepID=A0A8H6C7G5_9LECA|nr:uncharacterized protein HO133_005732 [Letharia lupina]KAF6218385.1 hypothetical protein HO133_005732 [Letharia lupina]